MTFTFDNEPENTRLRTCKPGAFEKTLVFPDAVAYIDDAALKSCFGITEAVLPPSLHASQHGLPFSAMIALERFSAASPAAQERPERQDAPDAHVPLGPGSPFSVRDGILYRLEKPNARCLARWPTGRDKAVFSIPDDVQTIGRYAFSNAPHLQKILFHPKVFSVQPHAFADCPMLTTVEMHRPRLIGEGAFLRCFNLKNIRMDRCPETLGEAAFFHCTRLEEVELKDGLVHLGSEAFASCVSLEKVILPDSLQRIGHRAFFNCFSLQQITLPPGVVSIGLHAFDHCSNLLKIFCTREVAALIPEYRDRITYIPSPQTP